MSPLESAIMVGVIAAVIWLAMVYMDRQETAARDRRAQKIRTLRRLGVRRISTVYGSFDIEEADESVLDEALTSIRGKKLVRIAG